MEEVETTIPTLSVIDTMTISSGGVVRISKTIQGLLGVKAGDRAILMQNKQKDGIIIQFQRDNNVYLRITGKLERFES